MLEHWYDALSQRIGIVLVTNNVQAAIQALYKVRRESGDADLSSLSVRINPLAPSSEIFIMKNGKV